jgi:hypothetical protein
MQDEDANTEADGVAIAVLLVLSFLSAFFCFFALVLADSRPIMFGLACGGVALFSLWLALLAPSPVRRWVLRAIAFPLGGR